MSDELLREIRDETLQNSEKLDQISNRLDSHEERMDTNEKRIRWSHKKLNELSGWRTGAAWIVGIVGSGATLLALLIQAGVI